MWAPTRNCRSPNVGANSEFSIPRVNGVEGRLVRSLEVRKDSDLAVQSGSTPFSSSNPRTRRVYYDHPVTCKNNSRINTKTKMLQSEKGAPCCKQLKGVVDSGQKF